MLAIQSKLIQIPDEHRTVHLQFRRFAGCPVCGLHLHQIVRRHYMILGIDQRSRRVPFGSERTIALCQ
jgi:hypothetical protein